MAGAIANLLVKIGADINELVTEADRGAAIVEKTAARINKSLDGIKDIGLGLSAAITAPLVGIGAAAIKMGIDAVESENLVSVSFGDMKKAADEWSAGLSKSLGLNRFETEKMAGTLFNMTKGMGFSKDAAFQMSTGIVKLAADMASFRNIPMEDALQKIQAGLVGEARPLKDIGILVDENTTKAYAYANGIAKQGSELTDQQKVLARYGLILKQTSNDQGDLARTLDSPANQLRIMKSRIEEAATSLGVTLLPVVQQAIGEVSKLVPYIQKAVEWFAGLPEPTRNAAVGIGVLAAAVGPALFVVGSLGQSITGLIPLMALLSKATGITGTSLVAFGTTAVPIVAALAGIAFGTYKVVGAVQDFKKALDEGRGATFLMQRDTDNWLRRLLGLGDAHKQVTPAIQNQTSATSDLQKQMADAKAIMDREIASLRNNQDATNANTAAQKEAEKRAKEHADALKDIHDAAVPLTAVQKTQIQQWDELGVSAGTIAKALGVSADAVGKYIEGVRRAVDADKEWAAMERQIAEEGHKFATKYFQDVQAAREKEAAARVNDMNNQLAMLVDFSEKNYQATLSGTEKELRQNELARQKEIASLKGRFDIEGELYKQAEREINESFARQAAEIATGLDETDQVVQTFGQKLKTHLVDNLKQIPQLLVNAFTGGGGLLGALQSIGSMIGSTLGETIGSGIKALGSLGGPIGAAIGSLAGPVISAFSKLFGSAGRNAVEDFAKSMGGFDVLHAKLLEIGAQGELLWTNLTQGVGKNNPKEAQAAIDAITKALDNQKQKISGVTSGVMDLVDQIVGLGGRLPASLDPYIQRLIDIGGLTDDQVSKLKSLSGEGEVDWKKMQDVANKYGIELGALGPAFQSSKLHDSAQQIWDDFKLLIDSGADTNGVLSGMSDEISHLVQDSLKFGVDIPENFRPLIQKLADSGQLIDENGDKIKDLDKIKFAPSIQTSVEILVGKIETLIDTLTQGLGGAINNLSGKEVHVKVKYDPDKLTLPDGSTAPGTGSEPPQFATGTRGSYVDFGGGSLAILHGHERISTEQEDLGVDGGGAFTLEAPQLQDFFNGKVVTIARKDAARGGLVPRTSARRRY